MRSPSEGLYMEKRRKLSPRALQHLGIRKSRRNSKGHYVRRREIGKSRGFCLRSQGKKYFKKEGVPSVGMVLVVKLLR